MKKKLVAVLMTAAMVTSLAACGRQLRRSRRRDYSTC